jgi:cytochrome c-type biogenesis protein CcmH
MTDATPFPTRLLAGVLVAVVAAGVAGYLKTGSPRYFSQAPEATQPEPSAAQIEQMVEGLAQRLKKEPENLEGWTMLGRSYQVMGRASDAVAAFREVQKRQPDNPNALIDVAGALAIGNGQRMTDEAIALTERALKLDPDNLKALSLAGSAAFDRQDWAGAVKHWQRIVEVAPPGSDFLPQVQAGIDEARQRGGLAAPAAKAAPAATGTAVAGRVTLAAALKAKAAPEDTVFVFARAAEGPRMPLAIVRKQVKDLPFDFVLDDSMAMNPAAKLSSAAKVVVGVRISKSGNAMAQPGDLQGQSEPVAPGATGVAIEIRDVVP